MAQRATRTGAESVFFSPSQHADAVMNDSPEYLLEQVNKRLTLNLLIQGSAQHAFLTSHYLVRDELAALDPNLLRLYDQIALGAFVQYWCAGSVSLLGWPDRFWRRLPRSRHPFGRHPLMSRHGLSLAVAAKQRAYERCRTKRVSRFAGWSDLQLLGRIGQARSKEASHKQALVELAQRATHEVWGIPKERLDGALTMSVAFGKRRWPTTFRAVILRGCVAGYGGVLAEGSEFRVVGKGLVWPLLSHELVKGTVELICMHGLNQLEPATYQEVLKATDRIEYESWMLQVGSELWRQLLPLLPDDRPVSEMVMHMARLPARSLERLMFAVVENGVWARELLAGLGREHGEPE
jgi:hypothetical protein